VCNASNKVFRYLVTHPSEASCNVFQASTLQEGKACTLEQANHNIPVIVAAPANADDTVYLEDLNIAVVPTRCAVHPNRVCLLLLYSTTLTVIPHLRLMRFSTVVFKVSS
jgi:hypothetical protein